MVTVLTRPTGSSSGSRALCHWKPPVGRGGASVDGCGTFRTPRPSAILGIDEIESTPRIPQRSLVPVRGKASGVFEDPSHVEEVPGHERGVAIGEVVLRAPRSWIEVGGARSGFTDPTGIGPGVG